jgi:hypothetical protein
LDYLSRFENQWVAKFRAEEESQYAKAVSEDQTFKEDVQKDWLAYTRPEVIEHYPPQLIIGKQVADDKEILVHDEDPLVKVTISEVTCEYNYSNPTQLFNLSIPHIEIRTNTYTTMSYQ